MDGSILEDVRVACNLNRDDDSFDDQLIFHTNGYLFRSAQAGVGKKGFSITGTDEVWTDFISEDFENFEAVKNYIGLSVLLAFDPPQTPGVLELIRGMVKEFEWSLYVEGDIHD